MSIKRNNINQANIQGYVAREPEFKVTERGPRLEIVLEVDRTEEIGKKEPLTLITESREIIGKLLKDQLKVGDFFVGDCVLHTFNYEKEQQFVCPHCHEKTTALKRAEIMNVDIVSYHFFRQQQDFHVSGVNNVIIRGTLYDDPKERVINGAIPRKYAKFKMKVKRTHRPGGDSYSDYDYPFAVAFGKNAELVLNNLHKGDEVLITGSVQERIYMKVFPDMICEKCRYEVSPRLNSYTREIIINKIEPLGKNFDMLKMAEDSQNNQ